MTRILLSCRSQEQKRAHINPSRADGSPSTLKIGPREDGLGLCWPHGEGHRRIHTPGIPECPESLPNFLHRGAPVPNPCFRRSSVTLRFTPQASGPQTQDNQVLPVGGTVLAHSRGKGHSIKPFRICAKGCEMGRSSSRESDTGTPAHRPLSPEKVRRCVESLGPIQGRSHQRRLRQF